MLKRSKPKPVETYLKSSAMTDVLPQASQQLIVDPTEKENTAAASLAAVEGENEKPKMSKSKKRRNRKKKSAIANSTAAANGATTNGGTGANAGTFPTEKGGEENVQPNSRNGETVNQQTKATKSRSQRQKEGLAQQKEPLRESQGNDINPTASVPKASGETVESPSSAEGRISKSKARKLRRKRQKQRAKNESSKTSTQMVESSNGGDENVEVKGATDQLGVETEHMSEAKPAVANPMVQDKSAIYEDDNTGSEKDNCECNACSIM